jgi:ACR3 family arsenite efflux pump ArsB
LENHPIFIPLRFFHGYLEIPSTSPNSSFTKKAEFSSHEVRRALHALKLGNTNLLTACGMTVMLLPPFAAVKYDEFFAALRRIPKRIAVGSVVVNWAMPGGVSPKILKMLKQSWRLKHQKMVVS